MTSPLDGSDLGMKITNRSSSLNRALIQPNSALALHHDEKIKQSFLTYRLIALYVRCGINEDPVTGSAHCALAPYWFEKLNSNAAEGESEKTSLTGYQASARGGEVGVSMSDSGKRVLLSGYCVTIMISKLLV